MRWVERLNRQVFNFVQSRNLVYNACWEDPRLDRAALRLQPHDRVLVITSAGCNALDYALDGPAQVHAVDLNPRQNALLELKLAGVRGLDYETFFALFGRGRLRDGQQVYRTRLRARLPGPARQYWDRHLGFFTGSGRRSFYFRGTSGGFAWLLNGYIDRIAKLRDAVEALLDAATLDEQRSLYDERIKPYFWRRSLRWLLGRNATMCLLGVPPAQRQQVEREHAGGIAGFIERCLDAVFAELPVADNYFWRVYLTGQYTPACCPEYLKPHNFARLQQGLVDRVSTYTGSVTEFLQQANAPISRFVLLDHMDWLATHGQAQLTAEWQAIVAQAAPGARVLWRSGGLHTPFVDRTEVAVGGRRRELGELLVYDRALAAELHPRDRVHTYGSFHIADLCAA